MNAHTLRKWSPIKIFMYLLLAICSLLVFWCQGASAMHLTPLDFSSFNVEHRRRHHQQQPETQLETQQQNHFLSLISRRNSSVISSNQNENSQFSSQSLHYQQPEPFDRQDVRLQRLWELRMREKRARIQAHRKQKLLVQQLLDQRAENLKSSANPNLNINNLKHLINRNIITQHNQHNNNKLNSKINTTSNDELFETLSEIMANISVASNRNRRDSRYHHHQQQQQQQQIQHSSNNNINANRNNRQRRRRYCSARDPRTLAFEAPTVFEGKIKSMTPDRQANFSVTVEILKVHKQQVNFTLPRQVRLQFAYKNSSECDIYREEFRHRGFVRDELEQGKIYFLFVKQISLGNFTILGQPIKKISRTAKDVEIGVSEKYGEYRLSFEIFISLFWDARKGRNQNECAREETNRLCNRTNSWLMKFIRVETVIKRRDSNDTIYKRSDWITSGFLTDWEIGSVVDFSSSSSSIGNCLRTCLTSKTFFFLIYISRKNFESEREMEK